jgi:hypothetical protein
MKTGNWISFLGLMLASFIQMYIGWLALTACLPLQLRMNDRQQLRSLQHVVKAASIHGFPTKSQLQDAVHLWLENSTAAILQYGPIESWNVAAVEDLSGLFAHAADFNENLNQWDVSNCRNLSYMFHGATSFNSDLSMWRLSNAIDLSHMFDSATSFNGDTSTWRLDSAVFLKRMMQNATSLDGNVGNWLSGSQTESASQGTISFRYAQNMTSMFKGATSFQGQGLDQWNTNAVIDMSSMFKDTVELSNMVGSQWNVRLVSDFSYMFHNTPLFSQQLCWQVQDQANTRGMFTGSMGTIGCTTSQVIKQEKAYTSYAIMTYRRSTILAAASILLFLPY